MMGKKGRPKNTTSSAFEEQRLKLTGGTGTSVSEHILPVELQQHIVDIFRDTFLDTLTSDSRQSVLQEIKAALYERDFKRAFSKSEYLEAYAARWSPSRALCYASTMIELRHHLAKITETDDTCENDDYHNDSLHVVSIGGGAAEVVGFGGFVRYMTEVFTPKRMVKTLERTNEHDAYKLKLHLVDSAGWDNCVLKLESSLTSSPPVSKYASQSTKDTSRPFIPSILEINFQQEDVLAMNIEHFSILCARKPILVTLLFTLNELYTTSRGKTTEFLLKLTSALRAGSFLLVLDSPGSYSETAVGGHAKKYPMKWLLDHTLLDDDQGKSLARWEIICSENSRWYRLPESIQYPIPLENMRYQLHFYRRI